MIPIELELTNFLAYQQPGPLSFEGIHVACLAGPNGAGKSSLLDAITWCLWGKARTNSADDLIHQGESEMAVSLIYEQGGQRFRVLRKRKAGKRGSSLLEFQGMEPENNSWQQLSEGTIRETQDRIDQSLRLDYDTFVNSAFLVQGRADEFTTKTPGQRKEVLSSILGLDRWEDFEALTKERLREVETQLRRVEGRLEELARELDQRSRYTAELAEAETDAEKIGDELAKAEATWASLEQSRKDLVSLQRQIDDLTRRIVEREREIAEANTELKQARAGANKAAIEAALSEVQGQLNKLAPVLEAREEAQQRRSALAEEMANLRGINQALGPETEPVKVRAATLETATDPICPTCRQPLTEEHRQQLLAGLHEEIEQRREDYRANRERIGELESEVGKLDQQLKQQADELKVRPALEKRAGELEAALSHADRSAEQVQAITTKIDRWQQALAEEKGKREEVENQASETERVLKAAALTQDAVDELRRRKRLADERVGARRQQLAALESIEQQHTEQRQARQDLTTDQSLLEELREAFGKRGIPAMIIETVVPELERSANELLGRMTDGRLHVRIETQREIKTGELREALDIIISDELGSRPYELYSGGEAFRINFAIRIALSKLLANRAGAQLRSLFIDEGFGTQDARGREQLVEAITSVQEDFDRILVITHIEALKDAFPARIEVRKTPQGSQFSLS
ncbi:MAG: SMC family ATPase [Anaerolineales bacterium]